MQKVVENKPRIKKVLREILVAVFSNGERERADGANDWAPLTIQIHVQCSAGGQLAVHFFTFLLKTLSAWSYITC